MSRDKDRMDDRYRQKKDKEKAYRAQLPGEDEAPLPPPVESIRSDEKPGRNDPCPCGSGKKYKQCCALKEGKKKKKKK